MNTTQNRHPLDLPLAIVRVVTFHRIGQQMTPDLVVRVSDSGSACMSIQPSPVREHFRNSFVSERDRLIDDGYIHTYVDLPDGMLWDFIEKDCPPNPEKSRVEISRVKGLIVIGFPVTKGVWLERRFSERDLRTAFENVNEIEAEMDILVKRLDNKLRHQNRPAPTPASRPQQQPQRQHQQAPQNSQPRHEQPQQRRETPQPAAVQPNEPLNSKVPPVQANARFRNAEQQPQNRPPNQGHNKPRHNERQQQPAPVSKSLIDAPQGNTYDPPKMFSADALMKAVVPTLKNGAESRPTATVVETATQTEVLPVVDVGVESPDSTGIVVALDETTNVELPPPPKGVIVWQGNAEPVEPDSTETIVEPTGSNDVPVEEAPVSERDIRAIGANALAGAGLVKTVAPTAKKPRAPRPKKVTAPGESA